MNFLDRISKYNKISNLMKIRGAELYHGADGPTGMSKLAVAFRNVADMPKSKTHRPTVWAERRVSES